MKCPCCGADLSLIESPVVVPVVETVEKPVRIVEKHEQKEVREAVKLLKKRRGHVYLVQDGFPYRIHSARTLRGRLFVNVGDILQEVHRWSDVVDKAGIPILSRL